LYFSQEIMIISSQIRSFDRHEPKDQLPLPHLTEKYDMVGRSKMRE
jgi:hypothetical protein